MGSAGRRIGRMRIAVTIFGLGFHSAGVASESPIPLADDKPVREALTTEVRDLLSRGDWAALDALNDRAWAGRERFPSGRWVIYWIRDRLTEPADEKSPVEWLRLGESLKAWRAARPESVHAAEALVQFHVGHGWFARGDGYADTVTEEGGRLLEERLGEAFAAFEV